MKFEEKLQLLRKNRKMSQEELAEKLDISRQAVAKWEAGTALPEIEKLIQLSTILGVTIDRLLKPDEDCRVSLVTVPCGDYRSWIPFLQKAKTVTYAGHGEQEKVPCRKCSHDLSYSEGDYEYFDTYLGGPFFTGEEALWVKGEPVWAMNYSGRVIAEPWEGDFLKEALALVPADIPFRGPRLHINGDYTYHNTVDGDFTWYQGREEIYHDGTLIYECVYHGGIIK